MSSSLCVLGAYRQLVLSSWELDLARWEIKLNGEDGQLEVGEIRLSQARNSQCKRHCTEIIGLSQTKAIKVYLIQVFSWHTTINYAQDSDGKTQRCARFNNASTLLIR
jgi:hypothetical protein